MARIFGRGHVAISLGVTVWFFLRPGETGPVLTAMPVSQFSHHARAVEKNIAR